MTFRMITALITSLLLAATGLQAEEKGAVEKQIRAGLEGAGNELQVESVEVSPVPGMYAVQLKNGPVVYATEKGDYFLVGDLYATGADGFTNLTEKRRDIKRREQLAGVSSDKMIVFPASGKTRAHITVFTDVTCFYCQKLHQEVPELNKHGVEVRYLAYPRAGVDSPGYRQLVTAWCAKDQQSALTRLKNKEPLPEKLCKDNPVAAQYSLGQSMGVRGTPAIVTADGRMIPGYQSAKALIEGLGLD
jgi:thiol:disulfide interchange protein DsbC